jgi:hypothetical protein
VFEHSYAAGSPDSGFYVGQCFPCNAQLRDVVSEWNGLGFSGTDAGGDLAVVSSVFRDNRAGLLAASATWEGCAPQREVAFVGNLVVDNNNDANAATGPGLLTQGNGILVGGGLDDVVERNRVSGHTTSGIGVVPFPEFDPVAPIPEPQDRPVDCVADAVVASDEVQATLDNPLVWPVEGNRVAENIVSGSGEWDLVVLTLDGEAHGNCFAGNMAEGITAPPDVDAVLPCDGDPRSFAPETARFLEILDRELPEPPSYEDVDLPDPGPQEEMADPEYAPIEPARAPDPLDLSAIEVPDAEG